VRCLSEGVRAVPSLRAGLIGVVALVRKAGERLAGAWTSCRLVWPYRPDSTATSRCPQAAVQPLDRHEQPTEIDALHCPFASPFHVGCFSCGANTRMLAANARVAGESGDPRRAIAS